MVREIAMVLAALTLAGCSELPASAPTSREVESSFTPNPSDVPGAEQEFAVVDIDSKVISTLGAAHVGGFAGKFASNAPAPDLRVRIGDTLQIAIVEAGGGLFGSSGGAAGVAPTLGAQTVGATATPLQAAVVAKDGKIFVPFAGNLVAAGKTTDEIRQSIEQALADKAIKPQAEVLLASSAAPNANSATVGGEVNHAGVFPLLASGNRLLDLIAEATGAKYPAYEINVHMTRHGATAVASLQNVVEDSAENVYIYPGDNIYLTHETRTFTVLGASQKVGRYPFDTQNVNLAEAVAEAGGLVDIVSDPAGVFLFRYESPEFMRKIRPEQTWRHDRPVPVVYKLNLRDGAGYFMARRFAMRDKDVILVANSDATQLLKFFSLLRGITGTINDVRVLGGTSSTSSHF